MNTKYAKVSGIDIQVEDPIVRVVTARKTSIGGHFFFAKAIWCDSIVVNPFDITGIRIPSLLRKQRPREIIARAGIFIEARIRGHRRPGMANFLLRLHKVDGLDSCEKCLLEYRIVGHLENGSRVAAKHSEPTLHHLC